MQPTVYCTYNSNIPALVKCADKIEHVAEVRYNSSRVCDQSTPSVVAAAIQVRVA